MMKGSKNDDETNEKQGNDCRFVARFILWAPNFAFDPKISVLVRHTIDRIGYNMTQISMATHQATHLDAPFHFLADGKTVVEE